jgi:hypothetical protein
MEVADVVHAPTDQKNAEPGHRHYLTASELFAKEDIQLVDVFVDVWGAWVTMKTLSGDDMARVADANNSDARKNGDMMLVLLSLWDRENKRPLMDMDQMARFRQKSILAFQQLQEAAMRLNKLGKFGKND